MAGNHSNPPATSAFAHVFDSCPDGDEREVLCEPLLDVTADGVRARVVDGIRTSEHIHLYFRCWTEGRRLQLCLTPSAAIGLADQLVKAARWARGDRPPAEAAAENGSEIVLPFRSHHSCL
jgi:hypothetical protein